MNYLKSLLARRQITYLVATVIVAYNSFYRVRYRNHHIEWVPSVSNLVIYGTFTFAAIALFYAVIDALYAGRKASVGARESAQPEEVRKTPGASTPTRKASVEARESAQPEEVRKSTPTIAIVLLVIAVVFLAAILSTPKPAPTPVGPRAKASPETAFDDIPIAQGRPVAPPEPSARAKAIEAFKDLIPAPGKPVAPPEGSALPVPRAGAPRPAGGP